MSESMTEVERIAEVYKTKKVKYIIDCMNLNADIGNWEYHINQILSPDEVKLFQALGYHVTLDTYTEGMFTISFE